MGGRVDGKVAFITGAARGQGRSHAIRFAEEGADVIIVDICADFSSTAYAGATEADLEETVELVEKLGRRAVSAVVDVRDYEALKAALDEGVSTLGRLDIVSANAGIGVPVSMVEAHEISEEAWREMIDVNLSGVWHTAKAAVPHLIAAGGGSIVLTSSAAGLKGFLNSANYVAAKHGIVGLMRTMAQELGRHRIRVNSVHPGSVDTKMIQNDTLYRTFCPDLENPTREDFAARSVPLHLLPEPWVEPVDISNAVLFLGSDEARYITGAALPVDLGYVTK